MLKEPISERQEEGGGGGVPALTLAVHATVLSSDRASWRRTHRFKRV